MREWIPVKQPANPRLQQDPDASAVLPGGRGGNWAVWPMMDLVFVFFDFCFFFFSFKIGFKTHVKVFFLSFFVFFFFLNSETDLFCTELFLG
jgi:hypothetical protein